MTMTECPASTSLCKTPRVGAHRPYLQADGGFFGDEEVFLGDAGRTIGHLWQIQSGFQTREQMGDELHALCFTAAERGALLAEL